jgi:hypothetical protein
MSEVIVVLLVREKSTEGLVRGGGGSGWSVSFRSLSRVIKGMAERARGRPCNQGEGARTFYQPSEVRK